MDGQTLVAVTSIAVAGLTIAISVLMVSQVPYPALSRVSLRSWTGRGQLALIATSTVLAITVPRYFLFPAMALYAFLGLARSVFLGLLDRLPDRDPLEDRVEGEPEETRFLDIGELGREEAPDEALIEKTTGLHSRRELDG